MKQFNRVYAKIDLDAIEFNIEQMKSHIGPDAQIIAVVKMDGYGHGSGSITTMFEQKEYVWGYATASLEEAVVLRESGAKKPILVLGCVFPDQYEEMLLQDIRATVYMEQTALEISKAADRLGKTAVVHIKIDTGMGRLGFLPNKESVKTISALSYLPHIQVEGMYTHFAKADESDKTYTYKQYEKFQEMKEALKAEGVTLPYCHCDNSAGIIDFPDMKQDLVRAGIATYGMYPSDSVAKKQMELHPALELISHVTYVKEVEAGTAISYGGIFVAKKKMKVATIPVGYGDGYARALSNKADVLIRGKRARILGRVCMDQFMVDVTGIPGVCFMDQVVLIGTDQKERISVEELGEISGRFNYEFVCCLGRRIPRVYVKGGAVVEQVEYL